MNTIELLHHLDAMAEGGTTHDVPYTGFAEAASTIRDLTAKVDELVRILAEERDDFDDHVAAVIAAAGGKTLMDVFAEEGDIFE